MPVAANPEKRDFYVYVFEFGGYPFYVGVGRSKRVAYRLTYVRRLMKPHNTEKLDAQALHIRVMAALLDQGKTPTWSETPREQLMTKPQAHEEEEATILRLDKAGFLLTNWNGNDRRHNDVDNAVAAILGGKHLRRASSPA
jgi:hypothetical protein